jgi:hypothetical protein
MAHDPIEFEEPEYSVCECCGQTSTHLTRFVSRDGDAFAAYLADFSTGHDHVSVLASFGGWGGEEGEFGPADRTAFAFQIWTKGDGYHVGFVDASKSGYTTDFFGRILDREEALKHPLRQEVFDLSDHIVECDQPIIEFLGQFRP